MHTYRIAMIGFGNVGQGFAEALVAHGAGYAAQFGAEFKIVAVSDLLKGSVYDPAGLDPAQLLAAVAATGKVESVPAPHAGWDALRTIRESNADVVVELSYTDLKTGEPAFTHARTALTGGKHFITTNKGPIALHYPALKQLAVKHGVRIGAEGTVMSGTPTLRFGLETLAGAGITRLQGIINGTTNYILTQMENGLPYAAALQEAQVKGYAEADPTGDVEGHDAAGKAVILANLLMGASLRLNDVDRQGITGLTLEDLASAQQRGERWKLLAKVERANGTVTASVRPTCLPITHPLASVSGPTNALTYTTDLLGDVTIIGPGAGRLPTGFAILSDLLAIHQRA